MTYIEDLILALAASSVSISIWDLQVISGFKDYILQKVGFTEKQCALAIKILYRYSRAMAIDGHGDITAFLSEPKFHLPIRIAVSTNSVDIIKKENEKFICVKFPFNEEFIAKIRNYRESNTDNGTIQWDKSTTSWIFSLNETNLQFVIELINDRNFDTDEEFMDYELQISEILENLENYAPMLVLEAGTPKITNFNENLPELSSSDILKSIFESRKMGITLWDEHIETYLKDPTHDQKTVEFLNTQNPVFLEKTDKICLKNVVENLGPSLVIIPGGDEINKILEAHTLFSDMNILNENMSVLFRLPNEIGKKFNDFVKNQGLNSPISDHTQIVFISGKMPKTILKSKIKFNSIINFGTDNAHYTLRNFLKNHENLVYFGVKKTVKF
jgi:hypothetical protein